MMMKKISLFTISLTILPFVANSEMVLIDNFDSYTAGSSASAQSADWTSTGGTNTVVSFGGDNAITVDQNGDGVRYANTSVFSIADGTTASTTFFQVYIASDAGSTAFQDFRILDTTSTSAGAARVSLSFRTTSAGTSIQTLAGAGGGGTELQFNDNRIGFNTLYNVWVVTNAASDTYSVFMSTGTDAAIGLEKINETGTASVSFLTTQTGNLDYIYLRNSSGQSMGSSYFDDIYFDASGQNLLNPVPEPGTMALFAGLAALGLIAARRRKHQ